MSVGAGRLVDDDDGAGAPEGRAMQSWVTGPFLGFDTETTGVDPRTDRIVSAALVMRDARGTRQRTWLVDPGVEIPQPASAVHGITTDHVRAEGLPPHQALEEIAAELTRATAAGVPVVVYNACFDIRLLEHELTRWGLPTLTDRLGRAPGPVLDPLVVDRALDRERPGKRTLADLCRHYRVPTPRALHTAEVDVLATLDLLDRLLEAFPELGQRSPAELHAWQRVWHRAWAVGHNDARAREGRSGPGADLEWPAPLDGAPGAAVAVG